MGLLLGNVEMSDWRSTQQTPTVPGVVVPVADLNRALAEPVQRRRARSADPSSAFPGICGDYGQEFPANTVGTIYYERDIMPFEYHNDPDRT